MPQSLYQQLWCQRTQYLTVGTDFVGAGADVTLAEANPARIWITIGVQAGGVLFPRVITDNGADQVIQGLSTTLPVLFSNVLYPGLPQLRWVCNIPFGTTVEVVECLAVVQSTAGRRRATQIIRPEVSDNAAIRTSTEHGIDSGNGQPASPSEQPPKGVDSVGTADKQSHPFIA